LLLFPTLHLQRRFGRVTGSFNITRRADWPSIGQFLPYRRITGPTTADAGNSDLRPERTLGIEVAARASLAGQDLSISLYSRRRDDVHENAIIATQEGGVLARPVNNGSRLSRGGQISARGKVFKAVRYSFSAWFAVARFNQLALLGIVRDESNEYGGNAQVDASHGKEGMPGSGQFSFSLRYFGATRELQSRTGGISSLDLSYTHVLTQKLAAVASLTRALGTRVITGERYGLNFAEESRTHLYGPVFHISLTYKLGRQHEKREDAALGR
jgi:outer membrane receptor protein involved in Fe transport